VAVVEAVPVAAAAPAAAPKAKSGGGGGGGGLSYTERKEMNKLEKEIEKLGTQIASYEDKLARCTEGYSVLAELTAEMNKLVLQLAAKEERWVELADMDAVGADA
jgi:ABC transport system ATP-binding/permease protein